MDIAQNMVQKWYSTKTNLFILLLDPYLSVVESDRLAVLVHILKNQLELQTAILRRSSTWLNM